MTPEETKRLQKELYQATQDFIEAVNEQLWNTELRTRAETIVILAQQFPGQPHEAPVVTHNNIDPNASQETLDAVAEVVKAAYSYKAPKVLTDEEIDRIAETTPPPSRANSYAEYCAEEAGFVRGLKYARDNRYLAPAAGLTVEGIEQLVKEWCLEWCERVAPDDSDWSDLRARLTAAHESKQKP